jgi:hypothetical protein
MFEAFEYTMPEWMKKYLPLLPSMLPGVPSNEEQMKEIEKYMRYDDEDDVEKAGLNLYLWKLLDTQIRLLVSLHQEDMLK